MKIIKTFAWTIVLLLLMRCAGSRARVEIGRYSFLYENKWWDIESITPSFAEGYNMLLYKDYDKILVKALDKEQDGVIDDVSIGDISISKAQLIYNEGLKAGERQGYIKKRSIAREYRGLIRGRRFILASYVLALGDIYNKLTLPDIADSEVVVMDLKADGRLDRIEKGMEALEFYQELYGEIVEMGIKAEKMFEHEGMILVKE